jgi:diguanylate cyclase (GGDEF)-like protein
MFSRLATKLTVLYAGLFGVAMLVVSVGVYTATTQHAQRQVRAELAAGANVFDRLRTLQADQLRDGAGVLARDFGFRQALASHDRPTIQSALENLRTRLNIDLALLVEVDGGAITSTNAATLGASEAALRAALEENDSADGVLFIGAVPYLVVATPVYSPTLAGWVVFAHRQDAKALAATQELSAIAFDAQLWTRAGATWSPVGATQATPKRASAFVADRIKDGAATPEFAPLAGGGALAIVKPLVVLDPNQPVALVLGYPLSRAFAPYQPLFLTLALLGMIGVALAIAGSYAIARDVTRPILSLAEATRRLRRGEHASVEVTTEDEVGRLADGFNHMAADIRQRQERITYLALHDEATDLPNRRSTDQHLNDLIARTDKIVAVAALGVDRFAHVRGAIGYELAAGLIAEIGARLMRLDKSMFVSRLSGDVLAIVFEAEDPDSARTLAMKTQAALEAPLELDEHRIDISLTAGLAAFPDHADDARTLLERANIALDQARATGRKLAWFDQEAYGDPAANLSLMSDMLGALESGAMALHYQPKYDLKEQRITGFEALVRWTHPRRGLIPPDSFISMAEETGHIRALTEWTLRRAINDQAALAAAGADMTMSVNISGRVLSDAEFAAAAIDIVRHAKGKICFEVTETAVIDNPLVALQMIDDFAEAGIEISIDDYGAGLSSLTYLKQIRADELKIDKSFVLAMSESHRDVLLVRSTIDLAHSLGMRVTAEGVETESALALLAGIGCDVAQGYLLARPMPIGDAFTLLKTESAHAKTA